MSQFNWDLPLCFLTNAHHRNKRTILIGGTDSASEGDWQWSDGTPFDYVNWKENEPNGRSGDGDALKIVRQGRSGNRAWYDTSTDSAEAFLCAFESCPPSMCT